ncbi:MAG: homoserine O-succinyltransferase [Pseudomonadota bacterium]
MPLVAHSKLPTFDALADQGHELLSLDSAVHQDIRELHIGFLNMMPDAALQATERQFIRLVGSCNRIVQFFVYPFSLPEIERSAATRAYIDQHYSRFEDLREAGLDALIITGANVANPALDEEPFWEPLTEVMHWAHEAVTSTLCSCLATHAFLKHLHGIERQPLAAKRWGVYAHRVTAKDHPLLREVNTRFDVPHSRHNDISRAQLEAAGLPVLAESDTGGVHLAASPDQFRVIYFQGHPEYDASSLWKEYKREVRRFAAGARKTPPPLPENYIDPEHVALARRLVDVIDIPDQVAAIEQRLSPRIDNTWGDSAKALFNNWLGLVYRCTDLDRRRPFMAHVDPGDPLGLRANSPHPTSNDSDEQ